MKYFIKNSITKIPICVITNLFFSFPTNCSEDSYLINYDFEIKNILHEFIKETERELVEERDAIKHLL